MLDVEISQGWDGLRYFRAPYPPSEQLSVDAEIELLNQLAKAGILGSVVARELGARAVLDRHVHPRQTFYDDGAGHHALASGLDPIKNCGGRAGRRVEAGPDGEDEVIAQLAHRGRIREFPRPRLTED